MKHPVTVLLALLFATNIFAQTALESKDGISLRFDDRTGSIVHFGKGTNLLSEEKAPLFRIRFLEDDGSFTVRTAFDASKCELSRKGKTVEYSYSGFEDDLDVTVRAKSDRKDGLFHFQIIVNTTKQIEWVEYPCVSVNRTEGEDEGILWPYNEGVLVRDASKHYYCEPEYPSQGNYGMYPGMVSTPFLAQVSNEGGLYLGAHDPENNTRHIDFQESGQKIRLINRLYPGVVAGDYSSRWETVLGYFEGRWQSAAEIYKAYFEKNHEGHVKLKDRKNLPDWYKSPFVVLTYCIRGHHDMDVMDSNKLFPYVNALPIVDEFSRKTDSPLMALLMHWEGTAPWAPPYVWPPYGGEDALKDFVTEMHSRGNSVGVYCSGMGWTQKSNVVDDYDRNDDFEAGHLESVMCRSPKGDLPLSKICTGQRSGYDMCPSQDFTVKVLKEEAGRIAGSGIDYVQMMDQNHGGTPYMCYSRDHGHPCVPGKWESETANALYKSIQDENPGVVLGCESAAAEVFIPNLLFSDNRTGLNFAFGQPVPLYSYIYHEYVNNFMGNNVCGDDIIDCRASRDNYLYRLAYSFLAGDLLTIVINDEGKIQWAWGQRDFSEEYQPDTEESLAFIKTLNAWRKHCPEFLQFGKAVRPLEFECSQDSIRTRANGDLAVPTVPSFAYKAGRKTCTFAVNWQKTEQTISSPELAGKRYRTSPDGRKQKIKSDRITIPPLSVIAIW